MMESVECSCVYLGEQFDLEIRAFRTIFLNKVRTRHRLFKIREKMSVFLSTHSSPVP